MPDCAVEAANATWICLGVVVADCPAHHKAGLQADGKWRPKTWVRAAGVGP